MTTSPKTYFIKTFGCQMNHSDSERIAGFLESYKLKPTSNINEADLVIFNTCGVRQMAEDRVYGQIHNLAKRETHNVKRTKIILTGCLANRKDVQKRLKDKVTLFCEIKDLFKNLPELLSSVIAREECTHDDRGNLKVKSTKQRDCHAPLHYARNDKHFDYLSIKPNYQSKFTAHVPIMTGCNNFCAYCVVPYARGREVSRAVDEIISEIKDLVKKGYKEIILLGQNVNSYKKNYSITSSPVYGRGCQSGAMTGEGLEASDKEVNFPKLLNLIEKIPGKFWINFMSAHPKDYSDELIETIAKSKKVCELIHLPIQAGDDKILKNMNRKYTAKEYLNLVNKIKKAFVKIRGKFALISITTDIIVGFPGETKKQFLESAEVMKKARYDMVYFGQFSARPGTAAWNMKDNVSKEEKSRREKYLNEILKKTTHSNNKKYVGKVLEVLVEKVESTNGISTPIMGVEIPEIYIYFARTRTGKHVKFESKKKDLVGKFMKVKITKANVWNLEGKIL